MFAPTLKSLIAQENSSTQELSMHSVSTVQCERVCFSGGHFANTVKRIAPIEGTNWASHDLELFPSLARHLLGLVVWYGPNVATFGGFSCSKRCCMVV